MSNKKSARSDSVDRSQRAESDTGIEESFRVPGHLIRRLGQAHAAVFARETEGYGITSPQLAALSGIELYPGIELARLAELVGYDAATLGAMTDRLVAKRLIRRVVGKRDRRTRQLFLTPRGRALVEDGQVAGARSSEYLLEPLTPAERQLFVDMMYRVIAHQRAAAKAE